MSKLDELRAYFTRRGYVYTWHPSGDEDDRNCQDEVRALIVEAERLDVVREHERMRGDSAYKRIAALEAENAKLRESNHDLVSENARIIGQLPPARRMQNPQWCEKCGGPCTASS